MRTVKGFTLIELMVTIAVLAILIAIAAPAMGTLIERNRVAAEVSRFLGMFEFARTEAVQKGVEVRVKQLGTNSWVVGTDNPGSCSDAVAIRCFDAPEVVNITTSGFSSGSISYNSQGQLAGLSITATAPTFTIKPKNTALCDSKNSKVITLMPIGRIKVSPGGC